VRASVIVPTYKRPQSLDRCLDALERQQQTPAEIIVVADRADADSQAVVRSRDHSVRLVLVSRPGVVGQMNAGAAASSGDVVALTDDDSAPHRDWLARILATYASDPQIGAVGGRDWIYREGGRLIDGSEPVVGTVDWLGRATGNHHLGVGPARDVDILKGVNLSVRGELLRELGFDERLVGVSTQDHWELSLCLAVRRRGLRIVYDPSIAVDHFPAPRVNDSRLFNDSELRDSVHNYTLAMLEHLPGWRQPLHLLWRFAVGTGSNPGLLQVARLAPNGPRSAWSSFVATQEGQLRALRTYRRCARAQTI
jgi:glycosyltransferase involved in cell wall biosynthesis